MSKDYKDLQILLLQGRSHEETKLEEQETFIKRCNLAPKQLWAVSVFDEELSVDILDHCDAIFIGGAGDLSAWKSYDWMPRLLALVREIVEREIPLFGSCWGHQIIARALGGKIIYDPDKTEMGCCSVELTEAGSQDELFSNFPKYFKANQGHHDRVSALPTDAIELAMSDVAPFQAFRIKNKPVYGTQFHSELDKETEYQRLVTYREYYPEVSSDEDFYKVIDTLEDTIEVDGLLKHFLELFACR